MLWNWKNTHLYYRLWCSSVEATWWKDCYHQASLCSCLATGWCQAEKGALRSFLTRTSASELQGCWMWGNPSSGCLVMWCLWDISYQQPAAHSFPPPGRHKPDFSWFCYPCYSSARWTQRLCHWPPCIRHGHCSLSGSNAAIEGRLLKHQWVCGGQCMCIFSSSWSLIIL